MTDFDSHALTDLSDYAMIMNLRGSYRVGEQVAAVIALDSFPDKANEKSNEQIVVNPPSVSTRHDITNQWCIYKWSRYIGIPEDDILQGAIIKQSLYYKYLMKRNILSEVPISTSYTPYRFTEHGKILLIDNEWDKGWKNFFQKLLSHTDIQLEIFDTDFGPSASVESLEVELKEKLSSYDPDVVLMDLRLLDADNRGTNFSSIYLQKLIVKHNGGIHTLVMTASNKAMNIHRLLEEKAKGYIIKESPTENYGEDYTRLAIEELCRSIDKGLKSAHYLKEVFTRVQNLKLRFAVMESRGEKEKAFSDSSQNILDIAFELLHAVSPSSPKNLQFAYFMLFLIVEDYANLPSVFERNAAKRNIVKDVTGNPVFTFEDKKGDLEFRENPIKHLALTYETTLTFKS